MLRYFVVALFCLLLAQPAVVAQQRVFKDATGRFSLEATLIRVDSDTAFLIASDGTEKTIPLAKLSEQDQAYVRDWLQSRKQAAPKKAFAALSPEQLQLAKTAEGILKKHCYECHGDQGANEGGFNFVMDVRRLIGGNQYVHPSNPDESTLLERIVDEEMPPEGVEPRPIEQEIDELRKWIAAGAPDWSTTNERPFVSIADMELWIQEDLAHCNPRERRYQRYFSLANLFNAGASSDELQTYRIAFAKLINSLSWNKTIIVPKTIDPHRVLFRIDLRDADWSEDSWNQILANYPYGYVTQPELGKFFGDNAGTPMPYVRVDWFVAQASAPPLYHQLLQVPKTVKELETFLRVDAATEIEQCKVRRAGFNRSGVSQNNRLIERHETPFGAYWKSYDFAGSSDRRNLFEFPNGPSNGKSSFEHDGGEMIFSLPNGFQGYMLTDAKGTRLDIGPTNIVSDPNRPDRAVTNGISCMSCHYNGIIDKEDEIRKHVEANRAAFPEADELLDMYCSTEEMNRLFHEDRQRFETALRQIGLVRPTKNGEPISNMARRFETELDLTQACAELGITPESFSDTLASNPALSRGVGQLTVPGGTMKRDAFVASFMDLVSAFQLGVRASGKGVVKNQVKGNGGNSGGGTEGGFGTPFPFSKERGGGRQSAFAEPDESDDESSGFGTEEDDDGAATEFKSRDRVQILWGSSWFNGTIVRKVGENRFEVHYDDWSDTFNEIVGPDRIRPRK